MKETFVTFSNRQLILDKNQSERIMPQLSELQQTTSTDTFMLGPGQRSDGEEYLVLDARSAQRPTGMVEEKLSRLIPADFSRLLFGKPR